VHDQHAKIGHMPVNLKIPLSRINVLPGRRCRILVAPIGHLGSYSLKIAV
jgi:hypothetical protein